MNGRFNRRTLLTFAATGAALLAIGACRENLTASHDTQSIPKGSETTMQSAIDTVTKSGEFSSMPQWQQDFSQMTDGSIDTGVWRYELNPDIPGYNGEAQGYTNSTKNVRLENGKLVIEAHRESYRYKNDFQKRTFNYTSGRIDTLDSLQFEYGKFEVNMKLPKGSGTWPAFWFLSANSPYTAALHPTEKDWADPRFYLHDGELDAMESYGTQPGVIDSTLHTFNASNSLLLNVPDAADNFHTYGVEVTPNKVVWTLDGKPYHTVEKPSENPNDWPIGHGNKLYAILNLAMGSTGGAINPSENSWRMEIKDAKFYEFTGVR